MPGLTPNQQRAVCTAGNVLVVAGAGTGKTRTLVERCLARILDPANPVALDELLVVTFTEAAAAEMRQRIRQRLDEELAGRPADVRLAEQAALAETAAISTLHGFCLQLVREHFHELGLDPQLTVLEPSQTIILAHRTLEDLLSRHFIGSSEADLAVQELVMTYGDGRADHVHKLILQLHDYTQTLPDPAGWLAAQQAAFAEPAPAHWERWLIEGAAAWREEWIEALGELPGENLRATECRAVLSGLPPAAGRSAVTAMLKALLALDADWPRGKKTAWRQPLDKLFQEAAFLRSLGAIEPAPGSAGAPSSAARGGQAAAQPAGTNAPAAKPPSDPLLEDWNWIRPPMSALLALTAEFDRAFASAKRELAALDFHDLEQFALQLLWDRSATAPTPLARRWRERLRLVLVDEYQDINAAQDCILRALSREGRDANRFLVGDVKQSIYRFRLANPHIFQRYADAWTQAGPAAHGTVIPLNENFRSRPAILEVVNAVFAPLLRREVGGVTYDDDARLRWGIGDPAPVGEPDEAPAVELRLRLTGGAAAREARDAGAPPGGDEDDEDDGRSEAEKEAALAAEYLKALKALPFMVWDESRGERRAVEWRDMVVLLRAPTGRAETFARVFAGAGIPLWVKRTGLYEAIEISDLLNLLHLLDNPLQDIPLLAVLRSPLGGLSVDELAVVRLALRNEPFWTALARFHEAFGEPDANGGARLTPSHPNLDSDKARQEPRPTGVMAAGQVRTAPGTSHEPTLTPLAAAQASAWPKVHQFLDRYRRWRELTRVGSLSQCLETVLDDTGYEDGLRTQPRGAQRVANVERLLAIARDFDRLQRQGLFRFLQFIEAQQEAEFDPEPAQIEAADAVRLMSIHQSKGLEFPVVVVADLGKKFNLQDLGERVILDERYGLAPVVRPPEQQRTYPSLPHWLAARRGRREALGEELRLLYVAFTRAREKLCLIGTASRKRAENDWTAPTGALGTARLLAASNALDWLGPLLPRLTGPANWLHPSQGRNGVLGWETIERSTPMPPAITVTESGDAFAPHPAAIVEALDPSWSYPHAPATHEAAKASVTSLRRRAQETEETAFWFPVPSVGPAGPVAPEPGGPPLTAAERGTAHHRVLELLVLDALDRAAALAGEVGRLRREGHLTAAEAAALDLEALAAFGQSELGRRIRAQAAWVRRELEFTTRLSPADFERLGLPCTPGLGEDEFVVVQGVVDLAVIAPGALWLVDFKTDAVTETTVADKALAYTPQLRLYALALERLFGRPATEAWLHFLALNRAVPVDLVQT